MGIAVVKNQSHIERPETRKLKENPLANIDLLEKVFGTVHISGGEDCLDKKGDDRVDQKGDDRVDQEGDNNDGDAEDTDATYNQVPPTQERAPA
ncbi:unnamed protein product [Eruca vesicaria subsp. sativa]|uniref:Uncharacterized protein n=1 Tax=Eruca vesicaria subsp. sativa TaxID=29727 RepID=A0ABC8L753_ERUVS|nr:unnamed protein product [Eruca vesicaria subsp. sativa]